MLIYSHSYNSLVVDTLLVDHEELTVDLAVQYILVVWGFGDWMNEYKQS